MKYINMKARQRGPEIASVVPIGSMLLSFPSISLWSGQISYGIFGPTLMFILSAIDLILNLMGVAMPNQQLGAGNAMVF